MTLGEVRQAIGLGKIGRKPPCQAGLIVPVYRQLFVRWTNFSLGISFDSSFRCSHRCSNRASEFSFGASPGQSENRSVRQAVR